MRPSLNLYGARNEQGTRVVVKADGLAAGKGVVVAATVEEAESAVDSMLRDLAFGQAGAPISCSQGLLSTDPLLSGRQHEPFHYRATGRG